MGLSQKLAAKRAAKEQRRAERQLTKSGDTAGQVVAGLRADRSPIDLAMLAKAAEMFSGDNDNEVMDTLLDKPHFRLMHAAAKEQLEGDWMGDFRKLLDVVKPIHKMQAQAVTLDQWKAYGFEAGLDEKGLLQGLQVIQIFRKSLDRNKLSKPRSRG